MSLFDCIMNAFSTVSGEFHTGTNKNSLLYDSSPLQIDMTRHACLSRSRFLLHSIHHDWIHQIAFRERPFMRAVIESVQWNTPLHTPALPYRLDLQRLLEKTIASLFPLLLSDDETAFTADTVHLQPKNHLNTIILRIGVVECCTVMKEDSERSISRFVSCLSGSLREDFIRFFRSPFFDRQQSGALSRDRLFKQTSSGRDAEILILELGITILSDCFWSLADPSFQTICCKLPFELARKLVCKMAGNERHRAQNGRVELNRILNQIQEVWYSGTRSRC